MQNVGNVIAALRRQKNTTQEELAQSVGVSAQAVSKWENGGMPDVDLLPKIADFFDVPVDALFGRGQKNHCDARQFFQSLFDGKTDAQKIQTMFGLCWEMEKAVFGSVGLHAGGTLEDTRKSIGEDNQVYSSVLFDSGFTRMGLGNRLSYFLLVPEAYDKNKAFFDGIDYPDFFRDFSDKNVFDAMLLLSRREGRKSFTWRLLAQELDVDGETVAKIIRVLQKYKLVRTTQLDTGDETAQEICSFEPSPSFVALLVFAREMIVCPCNFAYFMGNRNLPYL